jgi:hypothetical protein
MTGRTLLQSKACTPTFAHTQVRPIESRRNQERRRRVLVRAYLPLIVHGDLDEHHGVAASAILLVFAAAAERALRVPPAPSEAGGRQEHGVGEQHGRQGEARPRCGGQSRRHGRRARRVPQRDRDGGSAAARTPPAQEQQGLVVTAQPLRGRGGHMMPGSAAPARLLCPCVHPRAPAFRTLLFAGASVRHFFTACALSREHMKLWPGQGEWTMGVLEFTRCALQYQTDMWVVFLPGPTCQAWFKSLICA